MTEVTQNQMLLHAVLSVIPPPHNYREQVEEVDFARSRSHSDVPRILRTIVHAQNRFVQLQREERLRIYVEWLSLPHSRRVFAGPRCAPSCRLRP